jgi:hypothetical protein
VLRSRWHIHEAAPCEHLRLRQAASEAREPLSRMQLFRS